MKKNLGEVVAAAKKGREKTQGRKPCMPFPKNLDIINCEITRTHQETITDLTYQIRDKKITLSSDDFSNVF